MGGAALGSFDPLDVFAVATATEEAKIGRLTAIPGPVDTATLHLLVVDGQRNDVQHDEVLGDRKVMDHADVRHLDPCVPDFFALRRVLKQIDVIGAVTLGLITKAHQVAALAVDLRMRGEGLAVQLSTKAIDRIDRLQRVQIHGRWRAVFFECQQHAVVMNDVRVVRAAAQALGRRVVQIRVAVHREQQLPGLFLRNITLVAYEAALEVDPSTGELELADMAFAIEWDVARCQRILRIGTGAIKRAAQIRGDFALDFTVTDGELGAEQLRLATFFGGGHIAVEHVAGHRPRHLRHSRTTDDRCGCGKAGGST